MIINDRALTRSLGGQIDVGRCGHRLGLIRDGRLLHRLTDQLRLCKTEIDIVDIEVALTAEVVVCVKDTDIVGLGGIKALALGISQRQPQLVPSLMRQERGDRPIDLLVVGLTARGDLDLTAPRLRAHILHVDPHMQVSVSVHILADIHRGKLVLKDDLGRTRRLRGMLIGIRSLLDELLFGIQLDLLHTARGVLGHELGLFLDLKAEGIQVPVHRMEITLVIDLGVESVINVQCGALIAIQRVTDRAK